MSSPPPATTAFGSTGFDLAPGAPARAGAAGASPFDMCHGGVVLRAVLFVEIVLAIGVLFGASDFESWLTRLALGTGVALPGVLGWLVLSCLLRRPLAGLPAAGQWIAASLLGAACALACVALLGAIGFAAPAAQTLATLLAGAALAAALFYWLRLRAIAQGPADTSARLAELQARIRPHFLFNALNTAIALARVDPPRTEHLLEDLAELFRVALADERASVTLADELDLAQRYLAIEQIRFGDRLRVAWELDPAAAAARVPPLILQPLVENAVRHGVEAAPEGATIRVRTRARNGQAQVAIDNSLHGAPPRPGAGIALRNVRERLHLMHDVAARFEARQEGEVYRVRIVVPLGAP